MNIFNREHPGRWKCIYSIWNSNHHNIDFHSRIPADFSGNRKPDLSQSTAVPNIISSTYVIKQQEDKIIIDRSYEIQGKGPLKNLINCKIGREIKDDMKPGSQITTSFWSTDKQSFTIVEKYSSAGVEYKRTTRYSLPRRGECLNTSSPAVPEPAFVIPETDKQTQNLVPEHYGSKILRLYIELMEYVS